MAEWQHGLCGCFDNIGLCVITFFVPCYTFGKNAEMLGEDCCICGLAMCCGFSWGPQVALRYKLREKRGIDGSLTMDTLLTVFCALCTLCQEAQELRAMQGMGMAKQDIERT